MPTLEQNDDGVASTVETVMSTLRVAATILGIIAIVIGLLYAIKVFGAAFGALQDPDTIAPLLTKWQSAVGGNGLTVIIQEKTYPIAPFLAVAVLGVGAILLGWIALGIMLAGAKIVSWTAGDREAVKRILAHALGSQGTKAIKTESGRDKSESA
ncbi:MAG: hypothetical protein AB1696_00695 [Planctomycetota bacterium]